jgi:hypothetical protein
MILSEPSVKRLMSVADQVSHEPQGNTLLIAWRVC